MGRLGCAPERALDIAHLIHASEFLQLDGLCTHFSTAGRDDDGFTARQISIFSGVSQSLTAAGVPAACRHAASSAAVLRRTATHLDMVRPGLALYGVAPAPDLQKGLIPALQLKTQVIFLKDFGPGTPIGYERTHITSKRTRIATLPVGYNDGYPFRLGGRGEVLIRGRRAPVVGRVSMDYTMVDVGKIPGVSVGDEVVLLGTSGDETVTAAELAERAGTIPGPYTCSTPSSARSSAQSRYSGSQPVVAQKNGGLTSSSGHIMLARHSTPIEQLATVAHRSVVPSHMRICRHCSPISQSSGLRQTTSPLLVAIP